MILCTSLLQWRRKMRTPVLQHKHVQLDQEKLDKAKRVLGAKTETEALNRALDVVVSQAGAVKYLSAIVMMELLAGAFSAQDRKVLHGVKAAFAKTDRILLPTVAVYEE